MYIINAHGHYTIVIIIIDVMCEGEGRTLEKTLWGHVLFICANHVYVSGSGHKVYAGVIFGTAFDGGFVDKFESDYAARYRFCLRKGKILNAADRFYLRSVRFQYVYEFYSSKPTVFIRKNRTYFTTTTKKQNDRTRLKIFPLRISLI